MITGVLIRNQAGDVLDLPMRALTSSVRSDFLILGFDGFGPVKAGITTAPYAALPGSEVLSTRGGERSLQFTLGFSPHATRSIQIMRTELYTFLMTGEKVDITVYSDDVRTVTITGIVETHEPNMLSAVPSNSISIYCSNPDLMDLELLKAEGSSVDTFTIDYPGTLPSGFEVEVYVLSDTKSITISTTSPIAEFFTVTDNVRPTPLFKSGDRLILSTLPRKKGVFRRRGGVDTSIVAYKDTNSSWLTLKKGVNGIKVETGLAESQYKLSYRPRYGGL